MKLTIHIKVKKNISAFLNLIRKYDYVEVTDIEESDSEIPTEHKKLLDERLKKMKTERRHLKVGIR